MGSFMAAMLGPGVGAVLNESDMVGAGAGAGAGA